jgi:hypothetical protein
MKNQNVNSFFVLNKDITEILFQSEGGTFRHILAAFQY